MMPKRHRHTVSTSPLTPESIAPNATENEKMDKALRQQVQACNRKKWYLGSAVMLSLIALCLGLSLGLTLGRRHHGGSSETLLPVVDLNYSKYRGEELHNGVHQWLGIRYAAAPIGNLRFAAPQDPVHDDAVQNATKHRSTCLGTRTQVANQPISSSQGEDCLFLDLYAPSNATEDSRLPVYLFIQGGGFNENANANMNGTSLVKASGRNIIVISFNYRVSLYGFLASTEVQEAGSLNNGLLDQRKALYWVQKYISKFGGDPNHVVMGGASAGGGSVALQVAAYGGRNDNLFHATAAESQSFGAVRTVHGSQYQYNELVNRTKCNAKHTGHEDTLACLRHLSTAALQKQNIGTPFPGADQKPLFAYNPVVDNDFLSELTLALFEHGHFHNVPAIYGDVSDEGTIFVPRSLDSIEGFDSFIRAQFPTVNTTQLSTLRELYPTSSYPTTVRTAGNYWEATSAAYGELRYVCPGIYLGNQYYTHNSSSVVYNYQYNVTSDANIQNGLGVPHVAELIAIWDPLTLPESYRAHGPNAQVIPLLQAYWTSFIRFSDPNVARLPGSPKWEEWGGQQRQRRIRFQGGTNAATNTVMEPVPSDQSDRCEQLVRMGISLKQ